MSSRRKIIVSDETLREVTIVRPGGAVEFGNEIRAIMESYPQKNISAQPSKESHCSVRQTVRKCGANR